MTNLTIQITKQLEDEREAIQVTNWITDSLSADKDLEYSATVTTTISVPGQQHPD